MSDHLANDRFADQGVQSIDPANLDVLNELIKREPLFHRPEFGTTRRDFENMTVEAFWEVGASGRRYSRNYVLDTLEQRHSQRHEDIWETRDFHCLEIAPDNYLITYTLIQGLFGGDVVLIGRSFIIKARSSKWNDIVGDYRRTADVFFSSKFNSRKPRSKYGLISGGCIYRLVLNV
jgi:hypothetical protein